jgi:2-oxoglutarate dehydrogenase E2 component (dihydrolipoamide succinyltransferase)
VTSVDRKVVLTAPYLKAKPFSLVTLPFNFNGNMALELRIPSVGESVTNVTITQWLKKDGDYVEMDEAVAELESDKATVELNATAAGVLKVLVAEGTDVNVGTVVASIDTKAVAPKAKEKVAVPIAEKAGIDKVIEIVTKDAPAKNHASPLAAKILSEKGIEPAQVIGTGPGGRVTKADALSADINTVKGNYGQTTRTREVRRENMSNLRKTVARRLVAAKNETAMLTTFNEVNMQAIFDIRAKYKDKFKEKHGVGLGFMSFFTRACVLALKKFPSVNAFIDGNVTDGYQIEFHDYADISVAVSGPKGLMVPVIRDADTLTQWEIEAEIMRLASLVRDGKISIDEMEGGTFTITNGGVFGSMLSTPLLNPPQSAILGMHNIIERPIAENGQVVIRPMMFVALSYDHRIIDGRESVGFLMMVKTLLENPDQLLSGENPMNILLGL